MSRNVDEMKTLTARAVGAGAGAATVASMPTGNAGAGLVRRVEGFRGADVAGPEEERVTEGDGSRSWIPWVRAMFSIAAT